MAPGDVALSERSARELGVSTGAVINAGVIGKGASVRLRVTGIYAVPNLTLAVLVGWRSRILQLRAR